MPVTWPDGWVPGRGHREIQTTSRWRGRWACSLPLHGRPSHCTEVLGRIKVRTQKENAKRWGGARRLPAHDFPGQWLAQLGARHRHIAARCASQPLQLVLLKKRDESTSSASQVCPKPAGAPSAAPGSGPTAVPSEVTSIIDSCMRTSWQGAPAAATDGSGSVAEHGGGDQARLWGCWRGGSLGCRRMGLLRRRVQAAMRRARAPCAELRRRTTQACGSDEPVSEGVDEPSSSLCDRSASSACSPPREEQGGRAHSMAKPARWHGG
eukprot:scaffold29647_cov145-Isochrysis_galbana.AAC.4